MIHITKQTEPTIFTQWKVDHPNATYKHDLSNVADAEAKEAKRALKCSLMEEQKYLCCYCECRIIESDCHIEHFKPKGNPMYADLQLDYQNLFVSCTKDKPREEDMHCGHKKGIDYCDELVNPLEKDCTAHFTYDMQGRISYTDDRGRITIDMLRLNSELLNQQRKHLIEYFLDLDNEEELQEELTQHLDASKTVFGEFYTMIQHLHNSGQM